MIWACILGYLTMAVSFYLYITRTAQIEPDVEVDATHGSPTLTVVEGGPAETAPARKVA